MEEKKINKRIVFSVVAVLLLIVVVAGATYAYFSATASSAAQTVTTATMDLAFDDSTAIVNATNITPMYQSEIETKATKKSFTVTNNGTENMYLKMQLTDVTLDDELKDLWFRWALYEEGTRIGIGSFYEAGTEVFMKQNIVLEPGENNAKNYDLYIWIEESDEDQNAMQGKTFSGKVTVSGSMTKYEDVVLMEHITVNDGTTTPYYYDTNITEVKSLGLGSGDSIIYNEYRFNYNINMFTNLSSLEFVEGFSIPSGSQLPISLTEISGGSSLVGGHYDSMKHLTNLTSFSGYLELNDSVELPSSLTNANIKVVTIFASNVTYDFSNLVNLENFVFTGNSSYTITIILPKSIENTATINVTDATVVYQ